MPKKPSERVFPIEREIDGVKYAGTFTLEGETIRVSLRGGGTKATQLGGASPISIAAILLRELAEERKASEKPRK